MKLILDEWIVREVIDTLHMARVTFLGITGLDSPQEVAKKSANETAITRRISKSIDIIQQSEQPSLSGDLEEAAEKYRRESYKASMIPREDGTINRYAGSIKGAFIAGAEWQAAKMPMPEDTVLFQKGVAEGKRLMLENAVDAHVGKLGRNGFVQEESYSALMAYLDRFQDGDKVKVIIVNKEDEQ